MDPYRILCRYLGLTPFCSSVGMNFPAGALANLSQSFKENYCPDYFATCPHRPPDLGLENWQSLYLRTKNIRL
jgi:hypothetical protein